VVPVTEVSTFEWFDNPPYIVFRAAPGLTLPGRLEGRWEDARAAGSLFVIPPDGATPATARPTGRYETRGDGAWAEVYEVSW
jgi:hypothetical protein